MIVQIEVNTDCNFRCWFCQNAHYIPAPKQLMPLDLFEKILDKLLFFNISPLPLVSFAAYNEPTLDLFFKERLRLLTKKGFTYWWLSNGSGMTDDLVDFILDEKPSITNFVLNLCSAQPSTLAASVGVSERAAVLYLDQLKKAIRRLESCDRLFLIKVHGDGSSEHWLRLNEMRKWAQAPNVKVISAGVMSRAGMLPGIGETIHHSEHARILCGASYPSNIYIGVSGEVYLCCHDYYKKTVYANILDGTFSLNWKNLEKKRALSLLNKTYCAHCEFAINVTKYPLDALSFIARPYTRPLPRPLKHILRWMYRKLAK